VPTELAGGVGQLAVGADWRWAGWRRAGCSCRRGRRF